MYCGNFNALDNVTEIYGRCKPYALINVNIAWNAIVDN